MQTSFIPRSRTLVHSVEIDGLKLVQTMPTAVYLGSTLGLLSDDPADSYVAQHIYASSQDARGPLLSLPFGDYPNPPSQATKDNRLAECKGGKGLIGRFAVKWEKMLAASGGPFFLGSKPTIADCGVFEVMDYFATLFGAATYETCFAPFPKLRANVIATKQLGRLAEYCDVDMTKHATWDPVTKTHTNWAAYAKAVRTTLA